MKIVTVPPEEHFKIEDPFIMDRWMCSRCGLLLDYQFDPEEPGWPRFEPPLHVFVEWVDDDGDHQIDEPDRDEFCPRCGLDFQLASPVKVNISPMNRIEDLEQIIHQGEGGSIEFKEELPESAIRMANVIASFANTNGGRILFGVANDGSIIGFPGIDTPQGKDDFRQRVRGLLGRVQPKLDVRVDFFSDGKGTDISLVTIPRGPHPIYLSGNVPYVRNLDESRPATAEEITQIVLQRRPVPR